ncbi:MAG: type I-E CRISPR-associated protein Cse1/CasA, partial [Fimbriimonadaceae bacterium]|nr:type I-E CRISPR-associated protein Cse1/CasA [Fimbriimonadaceae bacterium]
CDDSPLITVAIHRLLLAILYRTFEGPTDFSQWKILYSPARFDPKAVGDYFTKWKIRFDLLSQTHPFYQMAGLETKGAISVNRLATECASGNNATLFDHCSDDERVDWTLDYTAKQLIACQSFALGFGKSGNATISGVKETLPYSADAIALRGMNVWLQGETLFETLMSNLAPIEVSSLPPWELNDSNQHRDRLEGKNRRSTTAYGIVDRLTWQSRLIRLLPEKDTVSKMYYTQGRAADKSPGDPMKVYRTSKEQGISTLGLSSGKAAWRDAHSILTIPVPSSKERRPECFNLVARARSAKIMQASKRLVVQVVGLASAPNKAGKFLLWRHERMPVPATLLGDLNLIERLGRLLQNAEQTATELNHRTRRIAKLYLSPNAEAPDGKQPKEEEIAKIVEAMDPRPPYWARLEKHFFALLDNLSKDWDEAKADWKPDDQQMATCRWRECVKREAERALNESIRSLGSTGRAIQAVARVRTDFTDDDLKPPPQKKAKAEGKTKGKGGKKK